MQLCFLFFFVLLIVIEFIILCLKCHSYDKNHTTGTCFLFLKWPVTVKYVIGALDSGIMFGDEHDGSTCRPYQLPTMSDMLICFPTQAGKL